MIKPRQPKAVQPRSVRKPARDADVFPISKNVGVIRNELKAKSQADKRRAKFLIHPRNADFLADFIPNPGETCHVVTRGDFIFGDWLPVLARLRGPISRLCITTLSASLQNVTTLARLLDSGAVEALDLWISKYFLGTDKANTPGKIAAELEPRANVTVGYARIHTKIILAECADGAALVYEGSANLRSSNTVEQVTVFNDRELLEFHRSWIATIRER